MPRAPSTALRRKRPSTRMGRSVAGRYAGMGAATSSLVRRRRLTYNPTPTFTETFRRSTQLNVGYGGGLFQVKINDIPQIADYQALYQQYRINWVKVTLIPDFTSYDPSTYLVAPASITAPRIAWAINDTPAQVAPTSIDDVLSDNGAKIKPLGAKWSCSFKPRPDKFTGDATGGSGVAVRERNQSWLSFADFLVNPLHNGVAFFIDYVATGSASQRFNVYYKVNFSLRDPK